MIKKIFEQLDSSFKENFKDVFDSLQSGASEEDLKELQEKCFKDKDLPPDLELLYKWHNGQTGYGSLNQNDNRTFLPIDEVIDAWEFLNGSITDIQGLMSKSWIPIAYNGGGDYLVYESEGENAGMVIAYWHDNDSREIEYRGLQEWLTAALEASRS
ncbi:SMI1/KNR4 family protein [Microbulbifer sp. ANSA003]|uniref:SMI1/KNR4 family protein n=1 Tax=Microbulbifer sp. ANSA003 TaxID=3243360 RepID=UPI00404220C2